METSTHTGGARPKDVSTEPHAHAILSAATEPPTPYALPPEPMPAQDPERQPGGAPHRVIGLTVLFIPVFAILAFVMVATSDGVIRIAGGALMMIGLVVFVSSMSKKAEVERDHDHPSR